MSATALPAAALFDMDGTLVDSESMMSSALARVLSDAGAALDQAEAQRLGLGRSWVDVHAELQVAQRTGWSVHEMVQRVVDATIEADQSPEVLTGAVELVHALLDAGVAVGVVSGSLRAEVCKTVERLGIAERLVCAHGAEDYPHGKPHPSGYLGAAALIGANPADCVVFEDSHVGVHAGIAAGMLVVATTEANAPPGAPGHQEVSAAHLVVEHLGHVTLPLLADLVATHRAK